MKAINCLVVYSAWERLIRRNYATTIQLMQVNFQLHVLLKITSASFTVVFIGRLFINNLTAQNDNFYYILIQKFMFCPLFVSFFAVSVATVFIEPWYCF